MTTFLTFRPTSRIRYRQGILYVSSLAYSVWKNGFMRRSLD